MVWSIRELVWKNIKVLTYHGTKYKLDIVFLIFAGLYLSIILSSLYISDDTHNYFMGKVYANESSIFSTMVDNFISSLGGGRFFPIFLLLFPIFGPLWYFMFSNIIIYKTMLILLTIFDLYIAGYLVKNITKSDNLKFLSMFWILFSFPLATLYAHSALYVFYGQMQFVVFFVLIAVIFYLKYLDLNKYKYAFISAIFFMFAMFYYEIVYTLIGLPILIAIIKGKRGKALIKSTYIIVGSFIFCTLLYFVLTNIFKDNTYYYGGTSVSLNFLKIIHTYFYQSFAALPMAEWLGALIIGSKQYFIYTPLIVLNSINLLDIIIVILWTICVPLLYHNFSKINNQMKQNVILLLGIGLYLWLFPGALVSITPKYQDELFLGRGYIPVFLECFGVGVIIATVFYSLISSFNKYMKILFVFIWLIGILVIIICQVNSRITLNALHLESNSYTYHKSLRAAGSGLLTNVLNDSCIITSSALSSYATQQTFRNSYAFSGILHKKITAINDESMKGYSYCQEKNIFRFDTISTNNTDSFYVSIASSNSIKHDNINLPLTKINIFIPSSYNQFQEYLFIYLFSDLGKMSILNKNKKGRIYEVIFYDKMPYSELKNNIHSFLMQTFFYNTATLDFNKKYNVGIFNKEIILTGFSWPEGSHIWSDGKKANISFLLEDRHPSTDDIKMIINGYVFNDSKVNIYFKDLLVSSIDATTPAPYIITIPSSIIKNGFISLDLIFYDIKSPAMIKELNSSDGRMLGIGINDITVTPSYIDN